MSYLDPIDHTAPDVADLFDELPLWSAPFGLALLDRVPLRPGLTILDVGAGTGFLTVELAERCGASATVLAVDPWKAAMARLRRKVAARGLENVRLLEQEVSTIDLPDASVDVIVSNLGLNNFEDPAAALRVCARVARPGATMLLTTNLSGHMDELYDVYREVLIEAGQGERLAALAAHVEHRGTVESVRASLAAAGFEGAEAATSSFRMRFADGSALLRHYFIRLGFVPGWKAIPAADTAPEIFERLERALNALAVERGELALTVPMACVMARRGDVGTERAGTRRDHARPPT
jgi:FkbM family methyltransferase